MGEVRGHALLFFPLLLKLTKRKQGRGRKILTAEETDREREGNENKGAGVEL